MLEKGVCRVVKENTVFAFKTSVGLFRELTRKSVGLVGLLSAVELNALEQHG